jgi:parallel beta-helix repeat protein
MLRKALISTIIILFVSIGVASAFNANPCIYSANLGDTLYVGGAGPGNYSRINDALENASSGDTIFVYSGFYFEDLVIEKPITLLGQDKNSTSLMGAGDLDDTITIFSDGVKIQGFTLQNPAPYVLGSVIIKATTNYSYIIDNIFVGDYSFYSLFASVYLISSSHCLVSRNYCPKGVIRVYWNSSFNEISYNTIDDTPNGIYVSNSPNNELSFNTIKGTTQEAIVLSYSANNKISYNTITNCNSGIYLLSHYCEVTYNNFISVKIKAKIVSSDSLWDHNYWGRPKILPKLIFWFAYISMPDGNYLEYYFDVDWHPAKIPN